MDTLQKNVTNSDHLAKTEIHRVCPALGILNLAKTRKSIRGLQVRKAEHMLLHICYMCTNSAYTDKV